MKNLFSHAEAQKRIVMVRIAAIVSILMLTGCAEDPSWQTKDVSGVLPDLEFRLTDERGEIVTEDAFLGRPTAVFFGYTHCPDICPITMGKLRMAIGQMPEDLRDDVQVLFVSVDPERDDPKRLTDYTASFGPQFTGLTSDEATLRDLTKRYRATFSYEAPDEDGDYLVSHPSAVYVFDAQGKARLLMRNDDPAQAIAQDFRRLVESAG
jgi:protein SCO1/2